MNAMTDAKATAQTAFGWRHIVEVLGVVRVSDGGGMRGAGLDEQPAEDPDRVRERVLLLAGEGGDVGRDDVGATGAGLPQGVGARPR